MIKLTVVSVAPNANTLAALRDIRRTDGAVAMSEDQHQDLLELEREQAELSHAKWAAGRMVAYLVQVVEDGGQFTRGGNGFIPCAVVRGQSRLEAAVELATDTHWQHAQLNTLRVKPRHWDAAKATFMALMERMIETEVGRGY